MTNSALKVLKLVNGEELIGMIQDGRDMEPEDGYTTENLLFINGPLKITCIYDKETRTHSLYLSDWVPSIMDDSLPIDKNKVLTLGNPTMDLEEHYYQLLLASQIMQEEANNRSDTEKKLDKMLKNHKFDDDDMN